MEEKKTLLSKLNMKDYMKDYRNELELVLENKQFDEEAKSLLLSVFYKLDNFYKDYMSVKNECEQKNKCLENFIKLIQTKCKKISIVQPQEFKGNSKFIIDRKSGAIQCIPNEYILFYAINELREKDFDNEKFLLDDFTNVCVNFVLSKGRAINATEPIRDFNGWSWNVQIDKAENINYNIIYQNLLMIYGYKQLNSFIGKSNIVDIMHNEIVEAGYGKQGEKFVEDIIEMCVILYNNASTDNHDKCVKYKKSLSSKIKMLTNRKEYAEDKYKSSSSISRQIKKIDQMFENIELLREEYIKDIKNSKNEYLGLSDYVEAKEKEKEKLLKKIKENNKSLNTKKYASEQDEYQTIIAYYNTVKEEEKKINTQSKLIILQKEVLECFSILISNVMQKKDAFNFVKELRYYANILIKKDKTVINQEQIKKAYEDVCKKLVELMIENKVIDTGFKSNKLNYQILKYVFTTKIIELENLVLKLSFLQKNMVEVEYYDTKILDYKNTYEIPFDEEISSRKDRKIKLFKIGG